MTITLDPSSMFVGGLVALAALALLGIGYVVREGMKVAKGKAGK